jgi:Na+-transporting methylmalonyl-CoA/oxaloacetate decarboxylase gamma subunit
MISFLKWAIVLTVVGFALGFLVLLIAVQQGRCDEIGNVEMPECVLDD